jgi:WD40 repeat protein/mono/diheme cytochrome c family protein
MVFRRGPAVRRIALLVALVAPGFALAADPTAADVKRILDTHCHRCHGQDGAVEGGFNYVLDLPKLLDRKKLLPGHADRSSLLRRIEDGTMPPAGEKPRVSAADLASLKSWVNSGAKLDSAPARTPVTADDVRQAVVTDLEKIDRRARRFIRYFTLNHLHNAGLSDDELQTYRNALAKLINSLSWHPKVRNPEPIDAAKTVLRIDLRWYMWDATLWNRVLADYPYGVLSDTAADRVVVVHTLTKLPVIRADWFVATASRAPLYYELLVLPGNLPELEKQLKIDAAVNIQQERVMRAAFNGSGVSRFNRVLERHDSVHGAYWRTYDFDEPPQNLTERTQTQPPDRRNVFAFPLGPGQVESSFQHAGGESIFALPNGLHAYYIVNATNDRINKAPTAVVSDPKRPDKAVEAGVSCMSCHVTGILPKGDQVRDHLEKNPRAFGRSDAEVISALYPGKDKVLAQMEADGKAYADAVAKTGARVSRFEAVSTITLKFEADVDLAFAAAEVGLEPDVLRQKIEASETLKKNVGALRVSGGTVGRPIWQQGFGDVVRELRLGVLFQANANGGNRADNTGEIDPLEGDGTNAAVFTADGRRAVVASADRGVRVWDVEAKRDVKRLVGHTASVWAVGLNADGSRAISGGMDGTARVWDVTSGREVARLDGHLGLVSAVALNADGSKALTGGFDGAVVWWDVAKATELRRLEGVEVKAVHAVALVPGKKLAAIAADRQVIVWDFATGEVRAKWEAHSASVTAVSAAEEGKLILTGGDDGRVKVWDAAGKLLAELKGHEGSIRSVAMKAGGRWAVSSSTDGTVKLWDVPAKLEAATFRKHTSPVVSAAFTPSGTKTVSLDAKLGTLLWDVAKFVNTDSTAPPLVREVPERIEKIK